MIRLCLSPHRSHFNSHRVWSNLVVDSFTDASTPRSRTIHPAQQSSSVSTIRCKTSIKQCTQTRFFSMIDRSMDESVRDESRGRKVWKAREEIMSELDIQDGPTLKTVQPSLWNRAVDDEDRSAVHESLARICEQVRRCFFLSFSLCLLCSFGLNTKQLYLPQSAGKGRRQNENKSFRCFTGRPSRRYENTCGELYRLVNYLFRFGSYYRKTCHKRLPYSDLICTNHELYYIQSVAAALAAALRDREDTLQLCADLLSQNRIGELSKVLRPYEPEFIHRRRHSKGRILDFTRGGFAQDNIELLRKGLNRMPRRVSTAHSKRAGVVLPICNVDGVPCILFEKRSRHLRAHADEVCLPGGMVSDTEDKSIVQTCLREMEEEIGIGPSSATVLGILRCNWGEVSFYFNIGVT